MDPLESAALLDGSAENAVADIDTAGVAGTTGGAIEADAVIIGAGPAGRARSEAIRYRRAEAERKPG